MNILKKFFVGLGIGVLLMFILTTNVQAAQSGDFSYNIISENNAEISGYTGTGGSVSIPSTLDGYTVTSIADGAFLSNTNLTSLTIPDSVTNLGYAFSGTALTSITLGSGITTINPGEFYNLLSLTSITLGKNVTSINSAAFYGTSLTSITIPDSVTNIGYSAFYGAPLTSIIIGSGITTINYGEFTGLSSLTSITIPDSVTTIGSGAFSGISSLVSAYFLGNTPSMMGDNVFDGSNSSFKLYYISGKTGFDGLWNTYSTSTFVSATTFTLTGPTSGTVNTASTNFTVTPDNQYTGTITITPTGVGSTGLSPIVLTFNDSSLPQTFTITPTVAGSVTLTATNNRSLTNPNTLIYTSIGGGSSPVVSSSTSGGSLKYGCTDPKASNYETFVSSNSSLCKYSDGTVVTTIQTTSKSLQTVSKVLKFKTTSSDVKLLQIYLNTHGYVIAKSGAGSLNNETNYFGSATKTAVISFQKANKLTADGVVGLKTLKEME